MWWLLLVIHSGLKSFLKKVKFIVSEVALFAPLLDFLERILRTDGFVKCVISPWILACYCDSSGNCFHFQALFLQHKILYTIKKRWDQIFWYRYRVFVFPNYGKFWSHSSKVPIWNYKVSTMLCCCTILLYLLLLTAKRKKLLVCVVIDLEQKMEPKH